MTASIEKKKSIQGKISGLFLIFGLLPLIVVMGFLQFLKPKFQEETQSVIVTESQAIIDTIDRNLFERYGDVQAFTLNAAVLDQNNWGKADPQNPLIGAIDGYISNYGIYSLSMVVDTNGVVQAINSKDKGGKTIPSDKLYGRSFKETPWFQKALNGDFTQGKNGLTGTVVEGPHVLPIQDEVYGTKNGFGLTFSAPIKDNQGKTVGVWVNFADIKLVEDIVTQKFDSLKAIGMNSAEVTLTDRHGLTLLHFNPERDKNNTIVRDMTIVGKENMGTKGHVGAQKVMEQPNGAFYDKNMDLVHSYGTSQGAYDFGGLGWHVLIDVPANEAFDNLISVQNVILITFGGAFVTILLLGLWVGRSFSRPLKDLSASMNEISSGHNLENIEIKYQDRQDEIGLMATNLLGFRDNAIAVQEHHRNEKGQARKQQEILRQEMLTLSDQLDREVQSSVGEVSSKAVTMLQHADSMSKTAEKLGNDASNVAVFSEEATQNVESVAAAAEELALSIQEISRQVSQAANVAQNAVSTAEETNITVQNLSEAAGRVGDVVKLISDIANQTNLLALNATIEAARAGEAGKGFAVVASEVKNLASQTTRATDEIASQISGIQGATTQAVHAIEAITTTIQQIDQISASIAAAVEQQGAATNEISRNTQRAAEGTRTVSSNLSSVSKDTVQTGALASNVRDITNEMAKSVQDLQDRLRVILRQSAAGDRRRHVRISPSNLTANISSNGKTYQCRVDNIGAGGMAVTLSDLKVPVGSALEIRLPNLDQVIYGTLGDVGGDLARINFTLTEALEEFMKGYIEKLQGGSGGLKAPGRSVA